MTVIDNRIAAAAIQEACRDNRGDSFRLNPERMKAMLPKSSPENANPTSVVVKREVTNSGNENLHRKSKGKTSVEDAA